MGEFYLETDRLIIRNWQDDDRDVFYLINSNDQVMEYFPIRRSRKESDKMMDDLREGITKNGFGFTAIALKENNQVIGFCGLADASAEDEVFLNCIEIGWRLAPQYWGKGYATEAARAVIEYGFDELKLPELLAFSVHSNQRSIAVMKRLGMVHDPSRDFDHPSVPDTHPHLSLHRTYFLKNPNKIEA